MKINTVDTVIQDFRDGQNIFRRPSVELMVREISRLQARVHELEQERLWIPVKEWPNIQGWYRVITGDGLEKTRFWGLDHENNRCFWHVESSNEWIMMWTKPTLPQPPKEGE
jgi:hypothetical protein